MALIKRSLLVPYSARQMFELVNAIEDYPRFLPWCHASQIMARDEKEIEARLDIAWSKIHKSFTTRNTLFPYERIDMTLVEGPFKHLSGSWHFRAHGEGACQVEFDLSFEVAGHFFDRMFQPVFHHIANSLVDLFHKRAVEIYGPHDR